MASKRVFNSNLALVDLVLNLLVGFVTLFIIAFLLINPVAKKSTVDLPTEMIVEVTWNNESRSDIDLYLNGPTGATVYYGNKNNGYISLEKDDLGTTTDTYTVNGEEVIVARNYEIISVNSLPIGEYVINVHGYFVHETVGKETARVRVTRISPFAIIHESSHDIGHKQEATAVSFVIAPDGKIVDVRDDVQIPLRIVKDREQ